MYKKFIARKLAEARRKELEHIVFYGNRKAERIEAFNEYLTWKPQTLREKAEKEVFVGMAYNNRRELREM